MEANRNIVVVPQKNESFLSEKKLVDYREYRQGFLTYLLRHSKNPQKAEGYSPYSVYNTANRLVRDLWMWKEHGCY